MTSFARRLAQEVRRIAAARVPRPKAGRNRTVRGPKHAPKTFSKGLEAIAAKIESSAADGPWVSEAGNATDVAEASEARPKIKSVYQ